MFETLQQVEQAERDAIEADEDAERFEATARAYESRYKAATAELDGVRAKLAAAETALAALAAAPRSPPPSVSAPAAAALPAPADGLVLPSTLPVPRPLGPSAAPNKTGALAHQVAATTPLPPPSASSGGKFQVSHALLLICGLKVGSTFLTSNCRVPRRRPRQGTRRILPTPNGSASPAVHPPSRKRLAKKPSWSGASKRPRRTRSP